METACDTGTLQTIQDLRAARTQAEAAVSAAERRSEELKAARGRVHQRGQALLRELRGVVAEARQVGLDRRRAVHHVRAGVAMCACQVLMGSEGGIAVGARAHRHRNKCTGIRSRIAYSQ
jgi:hypothetical protein